MKTKNYKRNIILFLVITGMIRVLLLLIPMGAIVWYKFNNSVTTDTEMIKK